MRTIAVLAAMIQICAATDISIGIESGMSSPLDSHDNLHYNPSIYLQPSITFWISPNLTFTGSYGHLFARGGEYIEDEGVWGDSFGNYRTDSRFFKLGLGTFIHGIALSSGIGTWYYRTERDLVGTWDAD